MKIAMLGHKRIPGREGGIEVVVEELATRMVKKGHDVVVYNRHKKGYNCPKQYRGVRIEDVPTIEKKATDAVVYSFLASIKVLFGKYDIIHYHAIGPSVFLIIPHFFRKKTVVTVHGLNYKTPKWNRFGAKFILLGEKITAKYADQIIVLSQEQKRYFLEKYNRETEYIPNGVTSLPRVKAKEITQKYGLKEKEYILFISRVVPGKGLEYLLDAYKKIDGTMPLVIAGDAEYVTDFRAMIGKKAKEDDRVKLIGFVEGKVLAELYSNARLFVFPSEAEGMPMCLLEAMSYNCPCLVSDIPENAEVGKEYVKYFQSKNTENLAKKLRECLQFGCETQPDCVEYMKKNYSWEMVVDKTLKMYKNILNKKDESRWRW
ncbi:glycosyltransferase family 4 protein [Roseburia inulinivorans]|nr:glycosyltransferase [Roseburia inulinivorans]